jgi:hypothetical protein
VTSKRVRFPQPPHRHRCVASGTGVGMPPA